MNEYDKCVVCDKETEYPVNQHIDMRRFYIEGAGQLCGVCYGDIYGRRKLYEEQKTILG